VVHDALQLELLEQMRGTHRFVLWIKIDTGMNRLGFPAAEFALALGVFAVSRPHRSRSACSRIWRAPTSATRA